ncbi:MAG TPA: hypothetical protein VGH53_06935 [Streptosporangiaceae bacterium]|jgi:hypothetical protein
MHECDAPVDLDQAVSFLAGAGVLWNLFGQPIKGTDAGPPHGGTGGVPFGSNGRPVVTNSSQAGKPCRAPEGDLRRPHMLELWGSQCDRSI